MSRNDLFRMLSLSLGVKWPTTIGYQQKSFNYLYSDMDELTHGRTPETFNGENHLELTFNELMKLANMEEYMTFTKADLETGMVVKERGGKLRMVLVDRLVAVSDGGYCELANYAQDLTVGVLGCNHHDIVEVFSVDNLWTLDINRLSLTSIWKRPAQTPQQKALAELEAKQQELIDQAEKIKADILKLKGM